MSMPTKDVTQGVVAAIADDALVMVANGSQWSPIKFSDLMKKVRGNISIGMRNLLKNSNIERKTAQTYAFSKALEVGKTYTLTACISLAAKDSRIALSLNGASFYDAFVEYESPACDHRIVTRTAKLTQPSVNFYVFGNDGQITCHWATVTEGNMPSTSWFPAPEDIALGNWGGVNQRFTISYDSPSDDCQKGGAHESADQGAGCSDKGCAGGYLTFGSLDALCRFIGESEEDGCDSPNVAGKTADAVGYNQSPNSKLLFESGMAIFCQRRDILGNGQWSAERIADNNRNHNGHESEICLLFLFHSDCSESRRKRPIRQVLPAAIGGRASKVDKYGVARKEVAI